MAVSVLQQSDVDEIRELVTKLSRSEKYGPLDNRSGVLVMTQSLLMQAWIHMRDKTDMIRIVEYYEMAARIACDNLEHVSQTFAIDKETLVNTCMAALPTNIVKSYKLELASAAVEAVLGLADWEKKQVKLELIHMKGKVGPKLGADLVHGIIVDKQMSRQQMPKRIKGAKVAFLSIESNIAVESSKMLHDEQLQDLIRKCEEIGATLVICQWNFDEKASHLLMQRKLTAVRGVSDVELKEISNATGGQVVKKIQDLSRDKLGEAKLVREKQIGKTKGRALYIESYASPGPVTIFIRAGNNIMLEETMRSLLMPSVHLSSRLLVRWMPFLWPQSQKTVVLLPIDMLTMLKSRHLKEKNAYLGIDCNGHGIDNMKEQHVFASLEGKKKQIFLALEVLKTMLELDDVT